jgi:hypothetical protein
MIPLDHVIPDLRIGALEDAEHVRPADDPPELAVMVHHRQSLGPVRLHVRPAASATGASGLIVTGLVVTYAAVMPVALDRSVNRRHASLAGSWETAGAASASLSSRSASDTAPMTGPVASMTGKALSRRRCSP